MWDGRGGFIKAAAARDILYGKVVMKSARDFYLWACKWAAAWKPREDAAVSEFIVLWVGKEESKVSRAQGKLKVLSSVPGIFDHYSWCAVSPREGARRWLRCVCLNCLQGHFNDCKYLEFVLNSTTLLPVASNFPWVHWKMARSGAAGIPASRQMALAKARALELMMAKQVAAGDNIAVYCGIDIDHAHTDDEVIVAAAPPYWVAHVLAPLVTRHPGKTTTDGRVFKPNEPYFEVLYFKRDLLDPMLHSLPQNADVPVVNEVVSVEGLRGVVSMHEKAAAVVAHRGLDPEVKPGDLIETCFRDGT